MQLKTLSEAESVWRRYAVYYVPPPGPFYDVLSDWLGWGLREGEARCHDVRDITAKPARYGIHATLKAPFELSSSATELRADLARLTAELSPVVLPPLKVERLGRFLALVPDGPAPALSRLAGNLVRGLSPHRVPLSPHEVAHRARGLSDAGRHNLERWGSAHVMEAFRFHITLTDRLPKAALPAVEAELLGALSGIAMPTAIEAVSLCAEDTHGRFHLLKDYPLGA
ncbi:Protein of unknown function [Poseidonocella pacifica]|uniref:Phosphonate metabolism protein n=1 Tax=Poseidonocella pacifica TaxID=871651 RepID=A0A1I0YH47_9RHOB|nr:DUF1045 domain-containing protein [Poseidonocella pacifica]SFB12066.1 Protein of unknown function [Poseidonocella pacifica]